MLRRCVVTALAAGAVVASSLGATTTSVAAPAAPPYPSSVVTVTKAVMVKKKVRQGKHPQVRVTVTSGARQRVTGRLAVTVSGRSQTVVYQGRATTVKLPKRLDRGWHTVKVTFLPKKNSIFRTSHDTTRVKIKKRR